MQRHVAAEINTMCEIYGFSGSREKELNTDLREFYSHAREHPNGWGLALLGQSETRVLREPKRADQSAAVSRLLSKPIAAKTALAHIRLATIGNVEYENCHPFVGTDESGRSWTLIHNGTIFESDKLNKYVFRQKGETDSERILLYIIDRINRETETKGRALDAKERFEVLDGIITRISYKNKLNLLIHDGEITYVHTNFRDSLYQRVEDGSVFFSSRPLSTGAWEHVPFMRLIGYREDESVFEGTAHDHEYFPDECSLNALYLAYSGL
jgi:glutamine amidotransferase